MPSTDPDFAGRLKILGVLWVLLGGFIAVGSATLFVPAWVASHGGGHTGVYTLTEPIGCDKLQPHRWCDWFGDFVSDDRTVVRHGMELSETPPDLTAGDTLRARYASSLTQVYREDDTSEWRNPALFLGISSGVCLVGLVMLEPWTWRRRFRVWRQARSR